MRFKKEEERSLLMRFENDDDQLDFTTNRMIKYQEIPETQQEQLVSESSASHLGGPMLSPVSLALQSKLRSEGRDSHYMKNNDSGGKIYRNPKLF